MRIHPWTLSRTGRGIVVALAVGVLVVLLAAVDSHAAAAPVKDKLVATIFSYDGQDFVRTESTVLTKDGKSVVGTKLDHDSPAFTALVDKRSYSGDANVFGRDYKANYAPLMGADGQLTGALFVGAPK